MMPPGKAISSFVIAVFIVACVAGAAKLSNSNSFPSVRKKILNGVRVVQTLLVAATPDAAAFATKTLPQYLSMPST